MKSKKLIAFLITLTLFSAYSAVQASGYRQSQSFNKPSDYPTKFISNNQQNIILDRYLLSVSERDNVVALSENGHIVHTSFGRFQPFPKEPGRVYSLGIGTEGECPILDDQSLGCDLDRREVGAGKVILKSFALRGAGTIGVRCYWISPNELKCIDPLLRMPRSPYISGLMPFNPIDVSSSPNNFGFSFSCAVASDGLVYCWGVGRLGSLGTGEDSFINAPRYTISSPFRVGVPPAKQVATAYLAACVLTHLNDVWCWGDLGDRRNGYSIGTPPTPINVADSAGYPIGLFSSPGSIHFCAVMSDGRVKCWGGNDEGQTGQPAGHDHHKTPYVVPLPEPVIQLALGYGRTCAMTRSGRVICWGSGREVWPVPPDAHIPQYIQGFRHAKPTLRVVPPVSLISPPKAGTAMATLSLIGPTGVPVSGTVVRVRSNRWADVDYISPYSGTLRDDGQFIVGITSTLPGQVLVEATDLDAEWDIAASTTLRFAVTGEEGALHARLDASPEQITSLDEHSMITLTLHTAQGQPLTGETIRLYTNRQEDSLVPSYGVINQDGIFTATLSSIAGGVSWITGTYGISETILPVATSVFFHIMQPSLRVNPESARADGTSSARVELRLFDRGSPVTNRQIQFRSIPDGLIFSPPDGTVNNGKLTSQVTSTVPGQFTIMAYDLTRNITLPTSAEVYFARRQSVAAKIFATPDVITAGLYSKINFRLFDVQTGELVNLYPIRFLIDHPEASISPQEVRSVSEQVLLHSPVSATVVVTAIEALYGMTVGSVEVKFVSGCPVRPRILNFIPSFLLGADVAYPHVPALPMPLDSNVEVDWGGCVPGRLEFYLENGKKAKWELLAVNPEGIKTHYAVRSFNLTEDLPIGKSKLKVVARTKDGLESLPLFIDVLGSEWPTWLVNLMGMFNPEDTVIMDSIAPDGTQISSYGSLAKMFSIAKIWPNPGGWLIEPVAVLMNEPNTVYTDEQGKKKEEAKEITKKHSTKLMIRGSLNLWLACDLPPSIMFQIFGSKKEFAQIGPVTIGGMANVNLTHKLSRNYLCFLIMPSFNEDYFRQGQTSGSVSADLYAQWKEALPKFLSTFMPPLRPWATSVCDIAERLKIFAFRKVNPDDKPPLTCEELFGEVYARLGVTAKTSMKWGITTNEGGALVPYFSEASGEIGPKLAIGYELARGPVYVNLEGNVIVLLKMATTRPVPVVELAPLQEVALSAEAFATVNLFNLWHSEPKWSYAHKWSLVNAPMLLAASDPLQALNIATSQPIADNSAAPDTVTFHPIPPAGSTPDYSQFGRRAALTFAPSQHHLQAASTSHASNFVTGVLASGYLTYSEVSLARHPDAGQALLVWTQDDPLRPVGGSREIYYSFWDGASWSLPAPLTADNVADIAPKVSWLSERKALVVWNRTRSLVSSTDDFSTLEIAYAVYDTITGQWSPTTYLTDNDSLDFGITLSRNSSGGALAAWISSEEEQTAIDAVLFNPEGEVVERNTLLTGTQRIHRISSAFGNEKAILAFASPGETGRLQISALLWDTGTWSEPIPILPFSEWEEHGNFGVAVDSEDVPWIAYVRSADPPDGEKYNLLHIRNVGASALMESSASLSNLQVDDVKLMKANDHFIAVLVGGDAHRDIYAMVTSYQHTDWSLPINLTNDSSSETSFDAHIAADQLQLVYVRTNYEVVSQTQQIEEGSTITYTRRQASGTDLVALSKTFQYQADLAVVPGGLTFEVQEGLAVPGATVHVTATVQNLGDIAADSVQVALYDGDPSEGGTLIDQRYLEDIQLHGGATSTVMFEWTLPEANAVDFYVVADPDNIVGESNEENNIFSTQMFGPALQTGSPSVFVQGNTARVAVPIHSIGTTSTLPSLLTVKLGYSDTHEIVISDMVPPIAPNDIYTAFVDLHIGSLQYGEYPITVTVQPAWTDQSAQLLQHTLNEQSETEVRQHSLKLLPNITLERIDSTDVTVPNILVMGAVKNTSWLTATNVIVAAFDASQRFETGLLMSQTIPILGPMQSVPITFLISEAAPCGLEVWVNPYGLSGTFEEQRFSDNGARIGGNDRLCTRAGFVMSTRSGPAPVTVAFTNTSTPNTVEWEWDFGDGTTSSEREPGAHVYTQPGVYTVTLRAKSAFTSTIWQERMALRVYAPARADFEADQQEVLVGQMVHFRNYSSGDVSDYRWNFGDGKSSGMQEPFHIYEQPGRYSVTLTVRGPGGTDTLSKTEHITVYSTRLFIPTVLRP